MRIIFAAPDRDLLECYKTILENDLGETVTAFDGTQVISLLLNERFDIVILDRDIPRIEHKKLTALTHEKGMPVIILANAPVNVSDLTEEILPNAYLSYPFTPDRLVSVVRDVINKASSGELLTVGDTEIDISGSRIRNGPRLTCGEIDVLKSLLCKAAVTAYDGACINALNVKFARMGSRTRIKYRTKKGFETVTEDE
ncbi:MAG: hypothetical protein IJS90_10170 [Clostridia bacterium]|nr:hypothetical protein [Clostridia bacterium]